MASQTGLVRYFALLLLILTGCASQRLLVRNEYIDQSYLASVHVDAPDPRRCSQYCGQKLIVTWKVHPKALKCGDAHLNISLRLRNLECVSFQVPVTSCRGHYVYSLLNEDYWETDGILTYKIELCSGDQVLKSWTHQVWARLIDLS